MPLNVTATDGSALGALALTAQRGVDSAHLSVLITNPGVTPVAGAFVTLYAEKTPGSGTWADHGNPVTDERMGRMQIMAAASPVTAGQTFIPGQIQALGYLSNAQLPVILPGDTLTIDLWVSQRGTSAGSAAVNVRFYFAGDSPACAIGDGITAISRGIDPGTNSAKSFLVSGRLLTATGTPDGNVHVAAGAWLFSGVDVTDGAETLALSQNDGAAVALAAGEAYGAAISQGLAAVPTVTKGVKALAGVIVYPSPPSGELLLGYAKVAYGAGGSIIAGADLSSTTLTYNRFLAIAPGSGLTVTIYPGDAYLSDFHQKLAVATVLALTASSTNRIWLAVNGSLVVTLTATIPSPGALLLWTAVTSGSAVTTLTDNRIFLPALTGTLALHASTHASGGTDPLTPAAIGAAALASPAFTGVPTAPTASAGTNTSQLATTAFVQSAVLAGVGGLADHEQIFTGDAVNQPPALSPAPASGTLPNVWINGVFQLRGTDYTVSGSNVTLIPIAAVSDVVVTQWKG